MTRTFRNLAVALLLASCASGPAERAPVVIVPGDRVTVVYEQRASSLRQSLITLPDAEAMSYYSQRNSDPLAKLLAVGDMQLLLDALSTSGLFRYAAADEAPGAVSVLRVDVNGQRYVWSKSAGMSIDELGGYNHAMVTFLNAYNQTDSFHVGGDENAILQEGERIRRQNEAARRHAATGSSGQVQR